MAGEGGVLERLLVMEELRGRDGGDDRGRDGKRGERERRGV